MTKEERKEWLDKVRDEEIMADEIPDELKTEETYLELVDWLPDLAVSMNWADEAWLTPKVAFKMAIRGTDPDNIPESLLSVKVCLALVKACADRHEYGDYNEVEPYIPEDIHDIVCFLQSRGTDPHSLADDYDGSDLDLDK